jgi:hypothetical protein
MGNSNNKQQTETINWDSNSIKGGNIDLDNDIKNLVANLRMNNNETEFNEDVIQSVLNKYIKKSEVVSLNNEDTDISASPFINADIYNYLQNKALKGQSHDNNNYHHNIDMDLQLNQMGGAKKQMTDLLDEDSSTSMTSSTGNSSSTDDISDSNDEFQKKHRKKKHHKKDHHRSLKARRETETDNLSYLSSSAHTGGEFTETNKSVSNENDHMGQDSIHTSDINMVSEY